MLLGSTIEQKNALPDHITNVDVQKVKEAALRKMTIAFNTHKKTVWANYVAAERKTPEFKGGEAKRTLARFRESQGIRII